MLRILAFNDILRCSSPAMQQQPFAHEFLSLLVVFRGGFQTYTSGSLKEGGDSHFPTTTKVESASPFSRIFSLVPKWVRGQWLSFIGVLKGLLGVNKPSTSPGDQRTYSSAGIRLNGRPSWSNCLCQVPPHFFDTQDSFRVSVDSSPVQRANNRDGPIFRAQEASRGGLQSCLQQQIPSSLAGSPLYCRIKNSMENQGISMLPQ